MKFFSLLLAATTAVSGLVIERAVVIPPKDQVWIEDVKWAGTGCPAGTVARTLSDDKQTLTLMFDSYIASIGPGVEVKERYKNCNINLKLKVPQGYAYTIHRTQYRGYTQLDKGVTATQNSIYSFAGDIKQWTARSTFKGPYEADYHFWDTIPQETLVWCNCGATTSLNINTSLRIQSPNPKYYAGLITTDTTEHKVFHTLGIQWKKC